MPDDGRPEVLVRQALVFRNFALRNSVLVTSQPRSYAHQVT